MPRELLLRLRQTLDAAIEADTPEAEAALAQKLAEVQAQIGGIAAPASDLALRQACDILEAVWHRGTAPPAQLPGDTASQARLTHVAADILAVQGFALAVGRGDLSQSLKTRGLMAGSLKALHANLRHLTWQTKMVAAGDLTQRVDFMGEFSEAFNLMVHNLAAARAQIRQHEAELLQANTDLSQEINERRRAEEELRQANLELKARNEELNAYAHTVAHDLKNPLGILLGYADFIQENAPDLATEELQQYVSRIVRNCQKLVRIVEELLLLASVRDAQVQRAPLDTAELVAGALGRLMQVSQQNRAKIVQPATWPVAQGYGPWIEEVWANFLSNAIKYGGRPDDSPPVPPHVELGATMLSLADGEHLLAAESGLPSAAGAGLPSAAGAGLPTEPAGAGLPTEPVAGAGLPTEPRRVVRFWVRDNGRGIAPEDQTRLFSPFERLGQVRITGHGLGLSIVRRIVERLGGEVGVASTVGQGSTFWFTLPAADDA